MQPNLLTQSEEFEFTALGQAYFYPRAILEEFLPFLHGSVMDVGAGIGQLTELLALAVGPQNIRALEPDPRFAKRFRNRLPHVQVLEKTSGSMPHGTTCDTVTSINVLEHIEDDVSELRHYHKWLAPSRGCLCLLVSARPELFSAIDKDFGHFRRYDRRSLTEILTQTGFTVHRLFYFNFAGLIYLIPALILGLTYIFLTYQLLKAKNKINEEKYSKKIFAFSILYLFLIFSLLLIESFFKIF